MKSNKSKKCVLSSSNFNELMDLPQVISNINLNRQFWHSLKETMHTRKESPSIKGRIFTAKRILTPIIQELMKDALEQIEATNSEEEDEEVAGKEVQVLYNNFKANDVWHVQTDGHKDGEEWAVKILREISRDLEQPFAKLREDDDVNETEERTSKDTLLSKTLLTKLVAIHQHLGNIIGRLKQRCKPKTKVVEDNDSLNNIQNRTYDIETSTSIDMGFLSGKPRGRLEDACNANSFSLNRQNVGYVTQGTGRYEQSSSRQEKRNIVKVENACSPINFDKSVKAGYAMSRKLLYDVAVSYHALFEENKNNSGNKEIVIKCLEDLEKVRTYLEALRDNKECEKPKFSDLESCKNGECFESTPHLHSNLHNMPMVLKLNKHADENERSSDLIIGIPSLTKSSPDVHILLNTKDQQETEQVERTQNEYKSQNRVSRIPKPIEKQRIDVAKFVKSNSMKITLENKECSRKNPANLLIFDPDDPSKSIIKMKEQKSVDLNKDTRSLVSNTRFILSHQENLMLYIICCIGGKTVKLKVNIDIWLVLKRFLFGKTSPAIPLCFSVMKLRLSVITFSLAAAQPRIENRLIFKNTGIDYNCPIEWNTSAPRPIKFNCESYLENYMDRLFNFTTFIKTKQKNPSSYQNTFNQKSYSFLNNFDMCKPKVGTIQTVYFFEYFKSRKTKKRNVTNYPKKWNYTSQNAAAYPIWTIKRSKYYSVPQTKTKEQEALERQAEETEEPSKLVEADSLENATGSHNEIHMQISEVSVHSKRSRENDVLETESDKLKTEIKRKVSFRDEVDISGANAETQDVEPQNCNVLPVPSEDHQNYVDDAELPLDKSPSSGSQKNLNKLSSRISDLLMTDSLMQLANEIPKRDKKKLKMAAQKSSPKNLKLTDSAKTVLAKLSKSFGDLEYTSGSGTLETDLVPQFYDEKGNPIVEVFNKDGDLLFSLKDDPIGDLATVLFDPNGLLLKNRYDAHGNRIRAVYDENAKVIRRISLINDEIKGVQADLETVEYYDHRGKPIKHLYDSSGYEIKTVGNDLTSRIFDADGRIRMEIYTRRGRRIDAVYDSRGRLLARVSDSQLIPCGRREQVRVAEMDADSLSKLFDCGSKSEDPKSENENSEKRNESPKRLYDQEGNPLIGVYDKKGRPIKLTSSGEADELLPFLFDNKGKLQSKRYDSKGKELKAVFGEDGKVISGMSIAWLNELLANSENEHATSKKKGSFFKRIYKSKSKTGKRYDIEKLYDSNGKIITSIFDSKGKPLAISLSGDATKLLPSLFGNGGKFIKRRFDSEKKRIRCVYGRDGNVISAISVTYLNRVTEKLKSEQNQEKPVDEPIVDNKKDWSCPQETVESMMTDTKTIKSFECADKIPVHLYDQDGNLLTDILDEDGNILVSTDSGNAWKLLPHLFDEKGKFVEKLYDKKGNELSTVYNKDGKNLNECLSVAMKITTDEEPLESLETGKDNDISGKEYNNNVNEEEEKFEEKVKINENPKHEIRNEHKHNKNKRTKKSKPKEPDLEPAKKESSAGFYELSVIENMSSPSKHVELNTVEQKHEDKQLKPTISITKKQSVNQNIDIPEEAPKAGDSIYRFFDQRGNQITEVYDHKGRALVKTKSGDVEQLAKYIFDKKGFLSNNIYDHKGRRITHIFDQKKRSISRISVPSIVSDEKLSNKQHRRSKGISGCIYDKDGNLIKEIYDRRGNLLIITKLVKFKDLAPIIFDDKGVRRRLYDKSGYEIGPVFDYKGKLLKNIPGYKKPKRKIYSISGKPLRNFYDSDGSLIIALYNDYGKTLCSVKKGTNNVELLSKFFFDKEGHFFKERFYNYRGEMIRHVYDSECNIVRSIKRTESRRIAHHKCTKYGGEKLSQKKNAGSANKLNVKINFASRHKQRGYHGKSEVRPVENITGTFSQSDTMLNPGKPLIQRSMSAYSIRDYPVQQEGAESLSSSASSLTDVSVKKFYDENGRLLTGVYNSKTRLLGYSASGNARVLAPYLFDMKGNFISGRYNLDRKFLKHIYDSNGKLVDKISKHVLDKNKEHRKTLRDFKFHDRNGDVVTSVYNLRDDKILKAKDSNEKAPKSVDKKGKPKKKFYNRRGSKVKTNEDQEIVAKESSAEIISDHESVSYEEKEEKERPESKGRFSILSSFRDKILTVIFDNQNRISQKLSMKTFNRTPKPKREKPKEDVYLKKNIAEIRAKVQRTHLYDKNLNVINKIYDDRKKAIKKLYNSDGKVIAELYSASGTLIKNNVLKNMFENNVFKPKVFNSEGNIITAIYTNDKHLKKVYDDKGEPAKLDSDLIYLVSELSLPREDIPGTSKSATKQVNYFSEGSSYPFPEGQNQKSQVNNQQLIEEQNYETELKVAFNGYARRTDNCTCEQCMHKKMDIVQFGGNLFNGLSRFTGPLGKFLSRSFSRREYSDDAEGELDSLETLIDKVGKQDTAVEAEGSDLEYYGSCSRVLLESDENVPISRKMIENTLRKCVHLNSSTNEVGRVSDTVIQHFANLILQQIEQKFYHKLDILQCRGNTSDDSIRPFQYDGENDICIGTELKFEDSLIGRHTSAQTSNPPVNMSKYQGLEMYGYFNSVEQDGRNHKAFVCKMPNLQPFIMMMKAKNESLDDLIGKK